MVNCMYVYTHKKDIKISLLFENYAGLCMFVK